MSHISPLQVFTVRDYFTGEYLGTARYVEERSAAAFAADPDSPIYEQWRRSNQSIAIFAFCDRSGIFYEDDCLVEPLYTL